MFDVHQFRRGDVFELKAPRKPKGHEQSGSRFAVVLQSDYLPLSTVVIAPTSTGRMAASFRPEISINGKLTRVLVEQLQAVDPELRLGRRVSHLEHADMHEISKACKTVLDL